jgi:hypothetical protein
MDSVSATVEMGLDGAQNMGPSDAALFRHRPKLKRLSSRVSNGKAVYAIGGDGRSAWTRRFRDIFDQHIADLGDPDAGLSEAQISLCRRCSALETELEQLEAKFSEGAKDADLDLYARVSGHLSRLFALVGVERRPRPTEAHLSLSTIATRIAAQKPPEAAQNGRVTLSNGAAIE